MSAKPSAILIGDSICMGYRPLVKERLKEQVTVLGIEGNGGDSGNVLSNLDDWIINREAEIIHLNCGLHDLKFERDTKAYQQPLDVYESNLRKIVERIKSESKARLIWVSTTPVIDKRHNSVKGFDRYIRDVKAYNEVANGIMKEARISINDLYSAIKNDDIAACLGNDGVHMTERGNRILADTVCSFLFDKLNR